MTFVGYDPRALTRLAAELTAGADHLQDLIQHHGATLDALSHHHLGRAADTLRHWAVRARSIATCEVMERVHHVELPEVPDRQVPLRHALAHRWQRDGLALVVVEDDHAYGLHHPALAAAADVLAHHPQRSLDDDDLTWLNHTARQGRGPLPVPVLVVLLGHVGRRLRRAELVGVRDDVALTAWNGLIEATRAQPDVVSQVIADLPPEVAAPVLAASELEGVALGEAATDVLARWELEAWWATGRDTPWNAVDHVLSAVITDAEALSVLWDERRHRPGLLLFGPNDGAHAQALMVALTDPAHTPMPVAAQRLLPLLAYVRDVPQAHADDLAALRRHLVLSPGFGDADEVRWWRLREGLAVATAPWMLWLTSGDERWGGSSGFGLDTMRWLIEAPGAASEFAHQLGPALQRRAEDLPLHAVARHDAIERMAWTIGAVDALVEEAQQPGDAGLQLLRSLLALSVGHAAGAAAAAATAAVAPPLAGVARTVSSGRVTEALDGDGGPEQDEQARLASLDRRSTAAAALVAVIAADHRRRRWLAAEVPAPPPPGSRPVTDPGAPDPLARWLAMLDELDDRQVSESARRELRQAWNAVTPASQRAAIDRGRAEVSP